MKHWINLPFNYGTQDTMKLVFNTNRNVSGFVKRYMWRDMYNGRYTLGTVLDDLNWCAENSTKLVIMPIDKTFKDAVLENEANPLPENLAAFAVPNKGGGYTALRWQAPVADAFLDLMMHLHWLQRHPGFGGVMLQETAPSLADDTVTGYTPEVYISTYLRLFKYFTGLYWQANYLPRAQQQISVIASVPEFIAGGHKLGGPDFLLTDEVLVKLAFSEWTEAQKAGTKLFANVSVPCYKQGIDFMINEANTRHIEDLFWTYKPFGTPDVFDALKVIV